MEECQHVAAGLQQRVEASDERLNQRIREKIEQVPADCPITLALLVSHVLLKELVRFGFRVGGDHDAKTKQRQVVMQIFGAEPMAKTGQEIDICLRRSPKIEVVHPAVRRANRVCEFAK